MRKRERKRSYKTAVCGSCGATFLFPLGDLEACGNGSVDGGWFAEKGSGWWRDRVEYLNSAFGCCCDKPEILWDCNGVREKGHHIGDHNIDLEDRPRTPML